MNSAPFKRRGQTQPHRILADGGHLVRELAESVAMAGRLAYHLPVRLRRPIGLDEARARVRHALETRERRFVETVERLVYGNPRSPYLALLREARCEPGDLGRLVEHEGVEGALLALASHGVYVSFDELKGRRDAIRGSTRFRFEPRDFDNPRVRPVLVMYTGGSGGRPSRVLLSLRTLDEWAATMTLVFKAHGVERSPMAVWIGVPIMQAIVSTMAGQRVVGSFYPVHPIPPVARAAAGYLALIARLAGASLPILQRLDLAESERMVAWLDDQLAASGSLVLWTVPSSAVRLSAAAIQSGRSLHGLTFLLSSEPTTDARRAQIEASGARAVPVYASVESAGLSYGCASPLTSDDVHLQSHQFAIVQRTRTLTEGERPVMAGMVSSLSPSASKVLLNCELGDHMLIQERDCSCLLGQIGLRTHLSEIRSFEKMTGEGVTFARTSLEEILEVRLPARFGGSSVDYQLAEEERTNGAVRLVLRVSPAAGPIDEDALSATLLDALADDDPVHQYHASIWRSAGTIEIRREPPLATRGGKVLPFHLAARAGHSDSRSSPRP